MKATLLRLLFALMVSLVLSFFSEKAYWYIGGYGDMLAVAVFYGFPTYATLWAIDYFRVRRMAPLFLAASIYGLLVEGVLTPVVYAGFPFNPISISYTSLAWHAPISVVFGWVMLRRALLDGDGRRVLRLAVAFGVFWGTWMMIWRLPEAFDDPELEGLTYTFSAGEMARYVAVTSLVMVLAHGLLGRRWLWHTAFKPSRVDGGLVLAMLGLLFGVIVLAVPYALLELPVLLGLIYWALRANRQREAEGSVLSDLAGTIPPRRLWPLALIPMLTAAIYALSARFPEDLIRVVFYGIYLVQTLGGLVGFGVALWYTRRPHRVENSPLELAEFDAPMSD